MYRVLDTVCCYFAGASRGRSDKIHWRASLSVVPTSADTRRWVTLYAHSLQWLPILHCTGWLDLLIDFGPSTWPESSTERKLPYSKRGALRKDPWMSLVLTRPSQPYVVWTIVYSLPFKLSVNKYVKTFYRQADYEAAHTLCYSCFCEQSRQNVVYVCSAA